MIMARSKENIMELATMQSPKKKYQSIRMSFEIAEITVIIASIQILEYLK